MWSSEHPSPSSSSWPYLPPPMGVGTASMYNCRSTEEDRYLESWLEGLNSGVPTITTATLTPTTLRSITETFVDQDESQHQHQAGFVPPVVPNQGFYMDLMSNKGWSAGRNTSRVRETPIPMEALKQPLSPSPVIIQPPRRNVGGRKPNKDKSISPEEEEKRQVRRERNKMAAARCRKRRQDKTMELEQETKELEHKKLELQKEISGYQKEKRDLEALLDSHRDSCRLIEHPPHSPPDVKPIINGEDLITNDILLGPPEKKPAIRPGYLNVPPPFPSPPISVSTGIPITTPCGTLNFNFDSLMEGGTGLTPVNCSALVPTSLVPSCSSQQRNNIPDLASPDSTKLVSL